MGVTLDRIPHHKTHTERLVLRDGFGNELHITHYPVHVEGDAVQGFTFKTVPAEEQVKALRGMMEERERLFLEYAIANHPDHPATLAHPDHPRNRENRK